jgi:hypothetical protein
MNATLCLAAVFACAQVGDAKPLDVQNPRPPQPAESRIVAVTVYQGQALVTREVRVPEGEGMLELVVAPMPPLSVDGSLYAEGGDGLRVLSTRFRSREVEKDARAEVRVKEDRLRELQAGANRLESEAAVQDQDLKFVEKLEGFTQSSLKRMTDDGRLDVSGILRLSNSLMETRAVRANAANTLRQQLQGNAEAIAFVKRQIQELSTTTVRTERDAILVVHKNRRDAGTVRLSYLVGGARWSPQYRLRAATAGGPVRLEYLAALSQLTGEPWGQVKLTLSNARAALDAAPPELLPLKMKLTDRSAPSSSPRAEELNRLIMAELEKPVDMHFANETPIEDVIKYVKSATSGTTLPQGLPIYIDPVGLQEAEKTMTSPVSIDLAKVPLGTSLDLLLGQLGLKYSVRGGVLRVTSQASEEAADEDRPSAQSGAIGMGGMGMAGMGGGMGAPGLSIEMTQATLNREAAGDQARELRVAEGPDPAGGPAEKDGPSLTFSVAGALDVPSQREPQLLEVAHADLVAEYYDKAVPVLTPRVYRLAKLTNAREFVILPGEATVYVGSDFVGRMRLPLVAAGEPFLAGFGIDPQVQVSRRLTRKARAIQGSNQVFTYEFRLGLRNYRPEAVKVELWDRLPAAEDESAAVNLVKTSVELSAEPSYQRTARADNLLRWDVLVPKETVGEKTFYLTYEFRLEYARELPQPRFLSGALIERPITGAAMGGMGGMGFR